MSKIIPKMKHIAIRNALLKNEKGEGAFKEEM